MKKTSDAIILQLERKNSGNATTLQKISFFAAGFIFILNIIDFSPETGKELQLFNIIYLTAYITGGAGNIAAAVFFNRIKTPGLTDIIVRWLNALTGLLLIFDSVYKFSSGKTALSVVVFIAGLLYLLIAFYWKALKQRKSVTLTNNHITFRKWQFRKKTIPFTALSRIELNGRQIEIILLSGKSYNLLLGDNDGSLIETFKQNINQVNKVPSG
jgi:hypothetical protein